MHLQIEQQKLLTGHKSGIYALEVIDQDTFLSAAGDGWVAEWPFGAGEDGQLISKVDTQIFAMAFHKAKNQIWLGDMNGGVYVIARNDKKLLKKVKHHDKGTYTVRSYGNQILTAGSDGIFSIWSTDELYPTESFQLSEGRLRAIAFHPKEEVMAISGGAGDIYIFHTKKWNWIQTIKNAHEDTVFDLVFQSDGDLLISASKDAHIKIWNWRESKLKRNIPSHNFTVNSLSVNNRGNWLATGSRDKSFKIWSTESWELLKVMDKHKKNHHMNSVNALQWHPEKDILITASDDRTIRLWKVEWEPGKND